MKYNKKQLYKIDKYYNYYLPALNKYLISKSEELDIVYSFRYGLGLVKKGSKYNYVRPDGTYLLSEWVDYADNFYEGFGVIKRPLNFIQRIIVAVLGDDIFDKRYNYINPKGNYLLKRGVNFVNRFSCGVGLVRLGKKYNYVTSRGTYLLKEGVDLACNFEGGFGVVKKDWWSWNYVKPDGTLLLKEWVDYAYNFREGIGKVEKDGKTYKIDKEGNEI